MNVLFRLTIWSASAFAAGFAENWAYFYDKPMDERMVTTADGNASAGVSLTDGDGRTAQRLRAMGGVPSLAAASEDELKLFAGQLRSILELYCVTFAGAPKPLALQAFVMLGKLALLDHMEVLGNGELARRQSKDLDRLITEQLRDAAAKFAVETVPRVAPAP